MNVHAESGGRRAERDHRAQQIEQMSRMHESEGGRICVLAGDFNARDGEDLLLRSEGWRDVWCEAQGMNASNPLSWTYRRGAHSARYDRVYVHDSTSSAAESVRMEAIEDVWSVLSDHKPLRVVVRRKPRASSGAPLLRAISNPERVEAEVAFGTSVGNSKTSQASTTVGCDAQLRAGQIAQARSPVRVVEIANAVTTLDKFFCQHTISCMEHLDDGDWTPPDVDPGPDDALVA